MNSDQITGILRAIIPGIVAWAAAKGWIPANLVTGFDDAVITILTVVVISIWSVHNNQTGKVIGQPAPLAPGK
jgi:hypothetical protein